MHILFRAGPGLHQQTFGQVGPAAVRVFGDDDGIAQSFQQQDRLFSGFGVVVVSKFIAEEVHCFLRSIPRIIFTTSFQMPVLYG